MEMEKSMALNNKETDGINTEEKVDSDPTYTKQGLTGDSKETTEKRNGILSLFFNEMGLVNEGKILSIRQLNTLGNWLDLDFSLKLSKN